MEEGKLHSDEHLKKFWEVKNPYLQNTTLSVNEEKVNKHFKETHHRNTKVKFVVPVPLKHDVTPLGKSRGRAIRRYTNLEKLLYAKAQFKEFADCINE